jgi:hypothetical protein
VGETRKEAAGRRPEREPPRPARGFPPVPRPPRPPPGSVELVVHGQTERGAEAFYAEALRFINTLEIPTMLGGTYAVKAYVGIDRPTKDIDIFCRAGDSMKILAAAKEAGYKTEIEDDRWIAKVGRGRYFCDIIFGSANAVAPVGDAWFQERIDATVLGVPVRLLPPTELVWAKSFIMDRYKFDGNDIAHVILCKHDALDWKKLLGYMEIHWEVLLFHLLRFRYIYPSEREKIPRWILDELISRLSAQVQMPTVFRKACRGRFFSQADFAIDVQQWGYADAIGDDRINTQPFRM